MELILIIADNVIAILENEGGRHPGMSEPFRGQVKIYVIASTYFKKINP